MGQRAHLCVEEEETVDGRKLFSREACGVDKEAQCADLLILHSRPSVRRVHPRGMKHPLLHPCDHLHLRSIKITRLQSKDQAVAGQRQEDVGVEGDALDDSEAPAAEHPDEVVPTLRVDLVGVNQDLRYLRGQGARFGVPGEGPGCGGYLRIKLEEAGGVLRGQRQKIEVADDVLCQCEGVILEGPAHHE
jgi:hypothetical protein